MKLTLNTPRALSALCAISVMSLAGIAGAQVSNGGFEAGSFAGWVYTGNTGSSATGTLLARDPLNAGTQAPLSGEWAPAGGNFFAALWSTDSLGSSSAQLMQSFTATAGQTLEFDVFFDFGDLAPNYDSATATVSWATGAVVVKAFNTDALNQLGSDVNVDWTHVSYALPGDGVYTLTFAVTDTDGTFESVLGVDNVRVIPAPSAAVVCLGGLGTLCMLGRRRR